MKSRLTLAALTLALHSGGACADSRAGEGSASQAPGKSPTATVIEDRPLEDYQVDLLELAIRTASALPLVPHVKNRSRFQESVALACLELDQPLRALSYFERIENWRRGAGYADYAFYCARHGDTSQVQPFLEKAMTVVASGTDDEKMQEWRRDRVRVKIAMTHRLLGHEEEAVRFEAGLAPSEVGKVAIVEAMLAGEEDAEDVVQDLNALILASSLDQIRNALAASSELYERFYDSEELRSKIQAQVLSIRGKVPAEIYVDFLLQLARTAAEHGDLSNSLTLVEEAQSTFDEAPWLPRHAVALTGRLAAAWHRAGDEAVARDLANQALAQYDAERKKIVDIWRAGALRPLAEAHHLMGDEDTALALYQRALDECVINPNSRPRAEDLVAICLSLALNEIEPDPLLGARLQQVHDGLGEPW